MKNQAFKNITSFFGITIFIIALLFLEKQLKEYNFNEILNHIDSIDIKIVLFSLFLVILNHLILTLYDFLAFKHFKIKLEHRNIFITSFISFVFGNNIGFSGFSSSAIRMRMYSYWKIPLSNILEIIIFSLISFWVGLIATVGIIFSFFPQKGIEALETSKLQLIGWGFLSISIIYLFISYYYKLSFSIKGKRFYFPSFKIAFFQILISMIDWIIVGASFYILLPNFSEINFIKFLFIFMLALLSGLMSNIPGGLGVFETVLLSGLSEYHSTNILLGTIFLFRLLFYIIPLIFATVFYTLFELIHIKELMKEIIKFIKELSTNLIHSFISILFFICGFFIFYDNNDNIFYKLNLKIPEYLLYLSYYIERITGLFMILVSLGLRKRLVNAYKFQIFIVLLGTIFSSINGINSEKLIIYFILLITLLKSKEYFYIKAMSNKKFYFEMWISIFLLSLISTTWIVVFSNKNLYHNQLIHWYLNINFQLPGYLKFLFFISILGLFFSLLKVTTISKYSISNPPKEQLEKVMEILKYSNNPYSNLALLGDKYFYFNEDNDTFIMYSIIGRYWISYSDPVGNETKYEKVINEFFEFSNKCGGKPIFYQINSKNFQLYLDLGMNLIKIGEEAEIELKNFSLEGKKRAKLRYIKNKFDKNGFIFEIIDKDNVFTIIDDLKIISDKWLSNKNVGEKKFSLGYFNEEYLKNFSIAIVKKNNKIIAFANIFKLESKKSICIDMMRYIPNEIDHVMEYLFINLIIWSKENYYQSYNLGMAPLSGIQYNKYTSIWNKVGYLLFNYGESIYNFKGIKSFKNQFNPNWEPKYIALQNYHELPQIMFSTSTLISGGIRKTIKK